MKLFKKFARKQRPYEPTRRERAAAARTAKAEVDLRETEAKIYELADRARRELRRSA
ncbi:hypothetical protein ABGB12_01775 [Actinocorallia sp. B10E7]|uniref:hypothetical protein n=1 Tax=Actinocorallia sp. B10E7 TaxID=3153558 RepID=UPI00325E7740